MRWPWQRRPPAPTAAGEAAAREAGTTPAPGQRRGPSPSGWAFHPPLQRTIATGMTIHEGRAIGWTATADSPTFTGRMTHLVDGASYSGVVDGDGGGITGTTADHLPVVPAPPAPPTVRGWRGPRPQAGGAALSSARARSAPGVPVLRYAIDPVAMPLVAHHDDVGPAAPVADVPVDDGAVDDGAVDDGAVAGMAAAGSGSSAGTPTPDAAAPAGHGAADRPPAPARAPGGEMSDGGTVVEIPLPAGRPVAAETPAPAVQRARAVPRRLGLGAPLTDRPDDLVVRRPPAGRDPAEATGPAGSPAPTATASGVGATAPNGTAAPGTEGTRSPAHGTTGGAAGTSTGGATGPDVQRATDPTAPVEAPLPPSPGPGAGVATLGGQTTEVDTSRVGAPGASSSRAAGRRPPAMPLPPSPAPGVPDSTGPGSIAPSTVSHGPSTPPAQGPSTAADRPLAAPARPAGATAGAGQRPVPGGAGVADGVPAAAVQRTADVPVEPARSAVAPPGEPAARADPADGARTDAGAVLADVAAAGARPTTGAPAGSSGTTEPTTATDGSTPPGAGLADVSPDAVVGPGSTADGAQAATLQRSAGLLGEPSSLAGAAAQSDGPAGPGHPPGSGGALPLHRPPHAADAPATSLVARDDTGAGERPAAQRAAEPGDRAPSTPAPSTTTPHGAPRQAPDARSPGAPPVTERPVVPGSTRDADRPAATPPAPGTPTTGGAGAPGSTPAVQRATGPRPDPARSRASDALPVAAPRDGGAHQGSPRSGAPGTTPVAPSPTAPRTPARSPVPPSPHPRPATAQLATAQTPAALRRRVPRPTDAGGTTPDTGATAHRAAPEARAAHRSAPEAPAAHATAAPGRATAPTLGTAVGHALDPAGPAAATLGAVAQRSAAAAGTTPGTRAEAAGALPVVVGHEHPGDEPTGHGRAAPTTLATTTLGPTIPGRPDEAAAPAVVRRLAPEPAAPGPAPSALAGPAPAGSAPARTTSVSGPALSRTAAGRVRPLPWRVIGRPATAHPVAQRRASEAPASVGTLAVRHRPVLTGLEAAVPPPSEPTDARDDADRPPAELAVQRAFTLGTVSSSARRARRRAAGTHRAPVTQDTGTGATGATGPATEDTAAGDGGAMTIEEVTTEVAAPLDGGPPPGERPQAAGRDLAGLADALYPRLLRRLRHDILLDRERRGLRTDRRVP